VFCPGCGAPLTLRPEPPIPALDTTLNLDRRGLEERPRSAPPAPQTSSGGPSSRAPTPPAGKVPTPRAPLSPTPPAGPGPRPAAPPPPARPRPVAPPVVERSRSDPRSPPLPRERRLDLGEGPRAAPRPPVPPLEPGPLPPGDLVDSGTVEVVVEPVEIHLRRASDARRALSWLLDGLPFVALFALALHLSLDRLPHASPLDLAGTAELAVTEDAGITGPVFAGVLVLFAVYQALSHALSGATLGKRIVRLRLVGPDGKRPGFARAAIRAVLAVLSLLLLGLGVLLALFTRSGRALHDLLARTWVVEVP